MPEGHACECGQRWVYQPAHWQAVYTVEEMRRQKEEGAFLRGIIPSSQEVQQSPDGVIVPIPTPKADNPTR